MRIVGKRWEYRDLVFEVIIKAVESLYKIKKT